MPQAGDWAAAEAGIIRATLEAARAVAAADNATLAVPEGPPGYLRVVASAADRPEQLWGSRSAPREGGGGRVAVTGLPLLLEEVGRSTAFRRLGGRTIESILALPFGLGEGDMGVLTVTAARPRAFSAADASRLAALAAPLAPALRVAGRAAWAEHLAGLAHDLATPVSSIRGFLALVAADDGLPAEQLHEYLGLAALATEQLVHLAGDMRDVLTLTQHRLHLRLAPVDPAELARAVAALFVPLAREAGIQLVCDLDAGLTTIIADRRRLERALGNLVQNALKYTPAGGQVRVVARRSAAVHLAVEDEGPGIAPADLPRLFETAYRGSLPAPRPVDGLGLGLAVARAIAHAHGGVLAAANRPQGGARFTLDLPFQPPPQPAAQPPAADHTEEAPRQALPTNGAIAAAIHGAAPLAGRP